MTTIQVARAILEAAETRRDLVASEKREHKTAKMMLFVVIGRYREIKPLFLFWH